MRVIVCVLPFVAKVSTQSKLVESGNAHRLNTLSKNPILVKIRTGPRIALASPYDLVFIIPDERAQSEVTGTASDRI